MSAPVALMPANTAGRLRAPSLMAIITTSLLIERTSACNSATGEPSYVLRALGRSDELAEASIRFSLGRFTQSADVEQAIGSFRRAVAHLQAISPLAIAGL